MSKKGIKKTGRPHLNIGNQLFLTKIKYKKLLHLAEIELMLWLSQSQPQKQIKRNKKGAIKKNTNKIHIKDLQQMKIGALSTQDRKELYKIFENICEIYKYQQISTDKIPNKFFSGPFELSFHLNQMNLKGMIISKQLQAESFLYLALLCLWKSQQLNRAHLLIIQSKIDYILTGLHIGNAKVLQRIQTQMHFHKKGNASEPIQHTNQEIMMLESQQALPKSLSSTQVEIVNSLQNYEENQSLEMRQEAQVVYQEGEHSQMQEVQEFQERLDQQQVEEQDQQMQQVLVQVKLRNPKKYKNKMIKKKQKSKPKGKPKKKKNIKILTTLEIEQNNKKLSRLLCNYICHSYYYALTKVIQMQNSEIMQSTLRIRQATDKKN